MLGSFARRAGWLVVVVALGWSIVGAGQPVPNAPTLPTHAGEIIPGSYIVLLKANARPNEVAAAHALTPRYTYQRVFNGFAATMPAGRLTALQHDPRVERVVQDRTVALVQPHTPPRKGKTPTPTLAVPPTSTSVPPTSAPPAATSIPPTSVPPTDVLPTATSIPLTSVPPTATSIPPTSVPPTSTATVVSSQVVPAGVQRIGAAPGSVTQTGQGVGVAIVDTGIDFSHPDLRVATACFTAFTSCADDHGHGTHVSGIVAALNNTRDVVGVAPDATLFAVKVLDSAGSGSDSGVIAGLDWVSANASTSTPPIRVVNMSLGGPASSDDSLFHAAVKSLHDSGISVVVAAGNDSSQEVSQMVPAGFPEVIAVASTAALTGQRGCFAQVVADAASYFTTDGRYDPTTGVGVTISAPGENKEDISGCWIFADGILSTAMGGGTTQMAGSSMSSPHVAGVAALMYQTGLYNQGTSAGPEAIRAKIRASANRRGLAPLDSVAAGYSYDGEREGIVNVVGALAP